MPCAPGWTRSWWARRRCAWRATGGWCRTPRTRAARERAGLPADPLGVVVTRSVALPADVGMLRAPENRVVVLTPSPDATLEPTAAEVSYVRGPLEEGVRRLRSELGIRSVLCEGGPQLLGDLVRADLVDELHLVIAPKLAGGHAPLTILERGRDRAAAGARPAQPARVRRLPLHALRA